MAGLRNSQAMGVVSVSGVGSGGILRMQYNG